MLRTIINGQSALKDELLKKIGKLENKVDEGFKEVKKEIRNNRKRIDKLGLDLAALSDDAPTIEEFDELEKRVSKIEHQVVAN